MKWRRLFVTAALIVAQNGDKACFQKSLKYHGERKNTSIMMIISRHVCKSGFATLAIMSHSDNSSVCLSQSGETVAVLDYRRPAARRLQTLTHEKTFVICMADDPAIRLSSHECKSYWHWMEIWGCNVHHFCLCLPVKGDVWVFCYLFIYSYFLFIRFS